MDNLKNEKTVVPQIVVAGKEVQAAKTQPKEVKADSGLMSQREAVFTEIMNVLKNDKVSFDGKSNVKSHLTDERLAKVYSGLASAFKAKKIALKDTPSNQKKLADPVEMKAYVQGLTNNWLRRDPRLNGKPKSN